MDKQQVLIVEDEPLIQQMLQDVLEEAGFAVSLSANREEAIESLQQSNPAHVALVTDIHLSKAGVTGWDVARRARELDRALPVIYSTGAAAADWPSNGVPNSIVITKPFASAQIVAAISQRLNAGSATSS